MESSGRLRTDPSRARTRADRHGSGRCDRRRGIEPTADLLADLSRPVDPRTILETFPEVLPTLRALRDRGVRMAVVSDAWPGLPQLHDALGMAGFFEAYAISALLGCHKPDPRMYRHASEALGLAPDECLFVDDGPIWSPPPSTSATRPARSCAYPRRSPAPCRPSPRSTRSCRCSDRVAATSCARPGPGRPATRAATGAPERCRGRCPARSASAGPRAGCGTGPPAAPRRSGSARRAPAVERTPGLVP